VSNLLAVFLLAYFAPQVYCAASACNAFTDCDSCIFNPDYQCKWCASSGCNPVSFHCDTAYLNSCCKTSNITTCQASSKCRWCGFDIKRCVDVELKCPIGKITIILIVVGIVGGVLVAGILYGLWYYCCSKPPQPYWVNDERRGSGSRGSGYRPLSTVDRMEPSVN